MAVTSKPIESADTKAKYTVLRAICIAGERVEVGASVEMTRSQYNEAVAAGKVGPYEGEPADPTEPAKPAKGKKAADATPTTEAAP